MGKVRHTTGCVCETPGFCKRHGVEKTAHLHKLCQTNKRYWNAWEAGRGPGQNGDGKPLRKRAKARGSTSVGLPGTELTAMLSWFGKERAGCKCKQHAVKMDVWGPDGCRRNMDTILRWLSVEAKHRKLPFVRSAVKALVLKAIKRAEIKALEVRDGYSHST